MQIDYEFHILAETNKYINIFLCLQQNERKNNNPLDVSNVPWHSRRKIKENRGRKYIATGDYVRTKLYS